MIAKLVLHELPLERKKLILIFVLIVSVFGFIIDSYLEISVDHFFHDAAVVAHPRTEWKHTAIVVLDSGVPIHVGRKQAYPLYTLAVERAYKAGAKAMYLDARIPLDVEMKMPFAQCIGENSFVEWSNPRCEIESNSCTVLSSKLGRNGPMKLSQPALNHFMMAPPFITVEPPRFEILFGRSAARAISGDIIARDEVVKRTDYLSSDGVSRWMDLSTSHASVRLAMRINDKLTMTRLNPQSGDETCNVNNLQFRPCRRVRFSKPIYNLNSQETHPIIPLSSLSSCDENRAVPYFQYLKNRAVIIQVTALNEPVDLHFSPMTVGFGSEHILTSGPQYLADAVETLLANDHPKRPWWMLRLMLIFFVATVSVLTGAYLKTPVAMIMPFFVGLLVAGLCVFNQEVQLWPVTAMFVTSVVGVFTTIAIHLILGARRGRVVARYLPKPIRSMLLSLTQRQKFINQRRNAIVLMSDLQAYTTITSTLKDPTAVFTLLNSYLEATTVTIQEKYDGWLEGYVADLVCFYWPDKTGLSDEERKKRALYASIELAKLQQHFFRSLPARKFKNIESSKLKEVSRLINAGISISSGAIVMGNIGPEKGIQKFGILGDALNVASRIEGLTRFFNTEILITDNLKNAAERNGLVVRRIANVFVKGRPNALMIYALGEKHDSRFFVENINLWYAWLEKIESGIVLSEDPHPLYKKDSDSMRLWFARGFLDIQSQTWMLSEK